MSVRGLDEAGRSSRVAVFGAPLDAGAGRRGAMMGPAALRIAGLMPELTSLGHEVVDRGDIDPDGSDPASRGADAPRFAHNFEEIAGWVGAIRRTTAGILADGFLPVLLGGDHSVAIGSVEAARARAEALGRSFFVLWIDAHADFNTPETSPSGNVHGMALAALCGEAGLERLYGASDRDAVSPDHVHLFGVRQIDAGERRLLRDRGVDVVDMTRIDAEGVARPLQRILQRVAAADGLLHVGLDVDALDPAIAPGVGTRVPGGLNDREAHLMMEMLHESGRLFSLDVVELNPFLDDQGCSARLLVDLVGSLFGRRIFERRSLAGSAG
jgi:arginase